MIKNISATSKNIKAAVNQLKEGNIIVYPTDTLYGFGVDASNETAIIKLNKLKERAQPLSILLSNINEIDKYAELNDYSRTKIFNLLPGPYTVLLKSKNNPKISKLVQAGSNLIGIRVINLDFCNEIIQRLGNPIITTSVNRHKMPSLSSIKEINKEFPDINIYYTHDSIKSSGSTIIDFSLKEEKVIRLGEGDY
tara:strand:+ start:327 stop:911 length:585 start_codon:yes stop_codon:yes gene_type:complete